MDDQLLIKENAVASVFLSYFNRAPEFQAMQWYVDLYSQLLEEQGDDPAAFPNAFKALAAQIYADGVGAGEVPAGSTITDEIYVNYLYQNILGREADAEGLAYWSAELGNGNIERAELVALLLDAAQGDPRDAAYVNNRTAVALEFSKWQNSNPGILESLEFNAADVLVGVNEDPASVETALERLYETTSQDGNLYFLTPDVDVITGTLVDDLFVATLGEVEGLGTDTLSAFDTLDGSSGHDILDIYTDGATAIPGTASIVNIEEIHFHYMDAIANGTIDASRFEGATAIWQIGAATNVTNVGADTVVGLSDITIAPAADESSPAQVLDIVFADASGAIQLDNVVVGEAEVVDIDYEEVELDEGVLLARGNSLASLSVAGELGGDDDAELNLDVVAGDKVATFTLNTEVDTFLNIAGAALTALDASASTGDIVIDIQDDADLTTVSTGSGDDIIIVGRLELTDAIDGGDGDDIVVLSNDIFQTQDYDAIVQLQNIEMLGFSANTLTLDAGEIADFKTLVFLGEYFDLDEDEGVTLNNLAADQTVVMVAHEGHEFGDQVLTLNNAAADVNVVLYGDVWTFIQVGAKGATGGTLTLSGEGAAEFSNIDGKFSVIDASGLDADSYLALVGWVETEEDGWIDLAGLSASVQETVILGDAGTGIYLNAGDTESGVAPSSSIGLLDTIEGFKSTEEIVWDNDYIAFLDVDGYSIEEISVEGAANLQQAWAKAAVASGGVDDVVFFLFEGDTYLFADTVDGEADRYDNGDFALKLIGEHDLSYIGEYFGY